MCWQYLRLSLLDLFFVFFLRKFVSGIVTTTRVTHASPAGTYAHTAERDWEHDAELLEDCGGVARDTLQKDIAYQLVHSAPGNQLKVF